MVLFEKMVGPKAAFFLCATLALSMTVSAGLLDLDSLLNPAERLLDDLIGNLGTDLSDLLNDVTGLVKDLLEALISVIDQIVKVLNIPAGRDPLLFVQNLVSQLEPIVNQLSGAVGSGVNEVLDDVSWF